MGWFCERTRTRRPGIPAGDVSGLSPGVRLLVRPDRGAAPGPGLSMLRKAASGALFSPGMSVPGRTRVMSRDDSRVSCSLMQDTGDPDDLPLRHFIAVPGDPVRNRFLYHFYHTVTHHYPGVRFPNDPCEV